METTREEEEINPKPNWLKSKLNGFTSQVSDTVLTAKKLAKDDPRRVIHAIKVGLAITLISLLYYFEPLFEGFGVAAMWAVLTVVVVFEYSVGATLGKGVNRVAATVFGAMLAVGAHYLAGLSGEKAEPFIIGFFVFLVATVMTFLRFIPKLKARYDYGLMLTILTFCLVCVSGYRDDEVLKMAHRRMSTILIGSSAAFSICILIFPVWAGTDLHNLVANNVEKLANFLQEFGEEYFDETEEGISDEKREFMEGFKSVLNSKNSEDSLINFARWEPRHGKFRYRHPWEQYQKVGDVTRQCACTIEALNRYLHARDKAPKEVKEKMEDVCRKMSSETGKALKEISTAMKKMTMPPPAARTHLRNSQSAAKALTSRLHTRVWAEHNIADVIPAAAVASLLLDPVICAGRLAESVRELGKLARFKKNEEIAAAAEVKEEGPPGLAKSVSTRLRSFSRAASGYYALTVEDDGNSRFPKYREPASLDLVQQTGE
ncbi:hypothetical protein V2J09_006923 [Rumex salicifolius]